MAEGLVSGVLGDDDEKAGVEAPEALAGAEAFAAAIAAIASRQDPEVARDTSAFLKQQSLLLETQRHHLEDEHELRLALLRQQTRLLRGQRLGQGFRIAFQTVTVLIALVVCIGLGVLLRDAFDARGVVLEPIDSPPALAGRGVTGKVVANGLLDELTRLQNATRSVAKKRDLSNAWANEVKLSVPEAGVSIAEISRLLRARFGHDVHIDGELIETASGAMSLTIRGTGIAPKSFNGPVADLDGLTRAAAEYVYSEAEPAQWALYLQQAGRYQEAVAFCRAAFSRVQPAERGRVLGIWGTALGSLGGSMREVLALDRISIRIQPDYWTGYNNIAADYKDLGDEEDAWRAGQELTRVAGGRPGRATQKAFNQYDLLTWNLLDLLAYRSADADSNGGSGNFLSNAGPMLALIEARLHDPAAAELRLQTLPDDATDPLVAATVHFVRGTLAMDAGDAPHAVAELGTFSAAMTNPAVALDHLGYNCWLAPAEEAAGHPDKADAVLRATGTFVDCYRFRGDILDRRNDWPGAQKAYADAVALAPDLPAGYYSWGLALARHGDLSGAESKLKDANQRGPHWADPLKAWGDVLAKQGHPKEALAKYDEALKYAPNWKQIKDAREALAKQTS
jgi:tetratricopeptide (TPR) repeat protein